MKTYVISIVSAKRRRAHITQIFNKKNITFLFFDAIEPSEILNKAIAEFVPSLKYQQFLSEVEKACFMSHIMLWKQAISEDLPYIAVFEDDVLLGENIGEFLHGDNWLTERTTENSAFIIRLETLLIPVNIRRSNIPIYQNREFHLLLSPHGGAAGYIISREAINFILKDLSDRPAEQIQPIDLMIFGEYLGRQNINIFQVTPGICIQELNFSQEQHKKSLLGSQLEEQRRKNQVIYKKKYKKHRSLKQRLSRALSKINREKRKREQVIIPFK